MALDPCDPCACQPTNVANDKFKQDVENILCQTLTVLGYTFADPGCDPCSCVPPNIGNEKFKQDVEVLLCALLSALSGSGPSGEWRLLGNAGTVDGTNFLGTTDAVPVTFRTTNLARWSIDTSGNLVGNATNGADIVFGNTTGIIRSNTSDGADNKSINISGGGAVNTSGTRGAFAEFQGNEGGSTGRLLIFAGNAGGVAQFGTKGAAAASFHTNALSRWSIDTSGNLLQDATNGGDVVFGVSASSFRTDTSDGTDNKSFYITGGGAINTSGTRGAWAEFCGNEINSGRLNLFAGNAGGNAAFGTKGTGSIVLATSNTTCFTIDSSGVLQNNTAANESTGAGTALLGTNCPAITVSAPFKWLKLKSQDGSTVYLPVWK